MRSQLIITGTILLLVAVSCTDKEKVAQLQNSYDSLKMEYNDRDSVLNEYLVLVSDIESNLNEIKKHENIIALQKENAPSNDIEAKRQMVKDLETINELMQENQKKIAELNGRLKNSNIRISQFKKMVSDLENKVAMKSDQIDSLNVQVAQLMDKNQTLNTRVDSLFTQNKQKEDHISKQDSTINALDESVHTAYYTAGTKDELESNNIIIKEGGLLGIGAVEKLKEDVDKSKFTSIDIRKLQSIPVNSKKVELVTNHPEGSYEWVMNEEEKQVDKLVIKNPDEFWGSSKYLVVVKK